MKPGFELKISQLMYVGTIDGKAQIYDLITKWTTIIYVSYQICVKNVLPIVTNTLLRDDH